MSDTPLPPIKIFFEIQLARVISRLSGNKSHASGPKKPSLGQQEHGE